MAEQTPAVFPSHPSDKALRVLNPLLRNLLRLPLLGGLAKEFMVLNFKGRKSGNPFSIPVSAHHIDNELYALVGTLWKLNFRGGAAAEVLHGGKTTPMRGELIEDPNVVADLFYRAAKSYGVKRAERMMGLKFRDQRVPTLAEFSAAVNENKLAAIRFSRA